MFSGLQDSHGYRLLYTQRMENQMPVTHLSNPQIAQMKSYLDTTATAAFPTPEGTDAVLPPVRSINTSLKKYLI